MEKLKLHTPDLTAQNLEKLSALFPGCVTETFDEHGKLTRAVDFDQLRQELSGSIVEGPRERYHLDWPGKREALLAANAPIAKTLRPCREESVDFDTTRNLFIEGDNLDALKLLQETYLGKVKMIYIDPPYNTGNEFIYDDDFGETTEDFLRRSNQVDDSRNLMLANPESNGRFHSDWLSMLYPRLKLARGMLAEDGVIFISIDDHEVAGLRLVCNEIFGNENFIATFAWQKRYSRENRGSIGDAHEYVVAYALSANQFKTSSGRIPLTEAQAKVYRAASGNENERWRGIPMTAQGFRPNQMYPITTPAGVTHSPPEGRCWSMIEAEYRKLEAAGRIYFGKDNTSQPQVIRYLYEVEGLTPWTWLPHEEVGHTDEAKKEIHGLLGKVSAFDTPKPTRLLTRLLQVAANTNDFLVMDFFAGSGTTAHAVYVMNARDGGTRRCITVQIAEIQDNSLDTERKNIAEICKERMRRAGKRVLDAWTTDQDKAGQLSLTVDGYGATIPPDIGFRVLKIDTSNMKDVYYIPDQSKQRELLSQVSNVKEDRTPEDLLFQVLVDRGVDLHLSIVQEVIEGFTVFFVDTNALAACFDTNLTEELVLALAKRQPLRAVFRDNSFEDDSARINVEQIFKTLSPRTSVRSI